MLANMSSSASVTNTEKNSSNLNTSMMSSVENQPETFSLDSMLNSNSGGETGVAASLCNDQSGLCLGSRGKIDTSRAGLYTKIVHLASRLDPYNTHDYARKDQDVGAGGGEKTSKLDYPVPFVSIETDCASVFIKEYDGHTIVLRVPNQATEEPFSARDMAKMSLSDTMDNTSTNANAANESSSDIGEMKNDQYNI